MGSFAAVSLGIGSSGSKMRKELHLQQFPTWANFTSSFLTLISDADEDDEIFLGAAEVVNDLTQSSC